MNKTEIKLLIYGVIGLGVGLMWLGNVLARLGL
jgi:hypothetical protein